jgi:hypothetical protein
MQTWASIERLNRYSDGISEYHSPIEFLIEAKHRFEHDPRFRKSKESLAAAHSFG